MKRGSSFEVTLVALCLLAVALLIWGVGESQKTIDDDPWKFAVVCDTRGNNTDTIGKSGINDELVVALANAIIDEGCDLVLVPGDMINGWCQNGSTSYADQFKNWKVAMAPVYDEGIEVYTIRGNHEDGSLPWPDPSYPYHSDSDPFLRDAYMDAFGDDNPDNGPESEKNLTYSFTYKNAFFVGLDQHIKPQRENQEWLDSQLASNSKPYIYD